MSSSEKMSVRLDTAPEAKLRSASSPFGLARSLAGGALRRRKAVNCTVVSSRMDRSPSAKSSAHDAVSMRPSPQAIIAAATSMRELVLSPRRFGLVCLLMCVLARAANAAVPPQEAARLGASLTPVGAERAGNNDGTIPAWTGGIGAVPGQNPAP